MANIVWEDDGVPSLKDTEEYMDYWSIVDNPQEGVYTDRQVSWNMLLVMQYMMKLRMSTYLAGAFYFPCIWKGLMGVMLCVSTNASTALGKLNENTCMQIVQNGIPRPEFLQYCAYFYNGLHFGNIRGFTDLVSVLIHL